MKQWLCGVLLGGCMINASISVADTQQIVIKTGYEVDGRTSASVLAAQRSHSVSSKDQTVLSVCTGLLAIGIVIFLVKALSARRS